MAALGLWGVPGNVPPNTQTSPRPPNNAFGGWQVRATMELSLGTEVWRVAVILIQNLGLPELVNKPSRPFWAC